MISQKYSLIIGLLGLSFANDEMTTLVSDNESGRKTHGLCVIKNIIYFSYRKTRQGKTLENDSVPVLLVLIKMGLIT